MQIQQYLSHPAFRKNIRHFNSGERLFYKGDLGSTLFIIIEGKIRLLALTDDGKAEYSVAVIEEGGILGERALFHTEPFVRRFSAQTVTNVTVLELSLPDVIEAQKKFPHFLELILLHYIRNFEGRLDRANQLVAVLRHENRTERILHCAQYLGNSIGAHDSHGIRVSELCHNISCQLGMPKAEVEKELGRLVEDKILVRVGTDDYVIPDFKAAA